MREKILTLVVLVVPVVVFAQKTPPPTPLPPPTVGHGLPISDYLPVLLIFGLVIGFYFVKKIKSVF